MGTTTQTTLINNYSARNNTASGKEDRDKPPTEAQIKARKAFAEKYAEKH